MSFAHTWNNFFIGESDRTREASRAVDANESTLSLDSAAMGSGKWNWNLKPQRDERFIEAKNKLAVNPISSGFNVVTDEQIRIEAKDLAMHEQHDREDFITNKIWGKPYIDPSNFAPELYKKRMDTVQKLQDKQLQLAKIKLQGNVGHNAEEWNLLYDVENGLVNIPKVGAHLALTE